MKAAWFASSAFAPSSLIFLDFSSLSEPDNNNEMTDAVRPPSLPQSSHCSPFSSHQKLTSNPHALQARLKATVFVAGLDNAVSTDILTNAFLPFGEIVDVTLPKPELPSSTDPHRGFGYVEFELPGDAQEAIDNMDQSELFGKVIKVAAAKPQKDSNEGLGSKQAIWTQVSIGGRVDAGGSAWIFADGAGLVFFRRAIWRNMR